MRALLLASVATVGCGRIGFDSLGDSGDASDGAGPPAGLRWVRTFLAQPGGQARVSAAISDGAGAAGVALPFTGGVEVDGTVVPAQNVATNALAIGLALADGGTRWSHALYAGSHCDLRAVAHDANGDVLFGGLTMGPVLGTGLPCDVGVGGTQDPMLLRYTSAGAFVSRTTWDAQVSNGQLHNLGISSDGSTVIHGVYGGQLTIDGVALPPAPACCEATFLARVSGTPTWRWGLASAAEVRPEKMDATPDGEVCVTGWLNAPADLFNVAVDPIGADEDVWVARIAADGSPRFVVVLGSTGNDHSGGVIATADGGCLVQLVFPADLPLGGAVGTLANMGGGDIALVALDAAGEATAAATIASPGSDLAWGLASTGTKTFAIVGISTRITIANTSIDPVLSDAVVVEVAGVVPAAVTLLVGGAGTVGIHGAQGRAGDLTVFGSFTGALAIGAFQADAPDPSAFVLDIDAE